MTTNNTQYTGRVRVSARLQNLRRYGIGLALTTVALVVQAPVAGASPSGFNQTPTIGIIPFSVDVFTLGEGGIIIPVDPSSIPASAISGALRKQVFDGARSLSASTLRDALALRNACRRCAICNFQVMCPS